MSTVFHKWMRARGAALRLHAVVIQQTWQQRERVIYGEPLLDAVLNDNDGAGLLIKGITLDCVNRLVTNAQYTVSVPLWT